jgi:hypothetical protein
MNYVTFGCTNDGVFNLFDATNAIVSSLMIINQMRSILDFSNSFCLKNDVTNSPVYNSGFATCSIINK